MALGPDERARHRNEQVWCLPACVLCAVARAHAVHAVGQVRIASKRYRARKKNLAKQLQEQLDGLQVRRRRRRRRRWSVAACSSRRPLRTAMQAERERLLRENEHQQAVIQQLTREQVRAASVVVVLRSSLTRVRRVALARRRVESQSAGADEGRVHHPQGTPVARGRTCQALFLQCIRRGAVGGYRENRCVCVRACGRVACPLCGRRVL